MSNGTNWDIGDVEQSVKESSNDFGFYGTIDASVELTVWKLWCCRLAYPTANKLKSTCDASEHQICRDISAK
jgi:hypothetical protein